jgi:hypothetical protein
VQQQQQQKQQGAEVLFYYQIMHTPFWYQNLAALHI